MASLTTPFPSTWISSSARRSDDTLFVGDKSFQRSRPRTDTRCLSELTMISLEPCTTRFPFGSTCVTRAESVVSRTFSRDVSPCPSRLFEPLISASEGNGPLTFNGPPSALTDAFAAEEREDLVVPLDMAEALSYTTMVTRSLT